MKFNIKYFTLYFLLSLCAIAHGLPDFEYTMNDLSEKLIVFQINEKDLIKNKSTYASLSKKDCISVPEIVDKATHILNEQLFFEAHPAYTKDGIHRKNNGGYEKDTKRKYGLSYMQLEVEEELVFWRVGIKYYPINGIIFELIFFTDGRLAPYVVRDKKE